MYKYILGLPNNTYTEKTLKTYKSNKIIKIYTGLVKKLADKNPEFNKSIKPMINKLLKYGSHKGGDGSDSDDNGEGLQILFDGTHLKNNILYEIIRLIDTVNQQINISTINSLIKIEEPENELFDSIYKLNNDGMESHPFKLIKNTQDKYEDPSLFIVDKFYRPKNPELKLNDLFKNEFVYWCYIYYVKGDTLDDDMSDNDKMFRVFGLRNKYYKNESKKYIFNSRNTLASYVADPSRLSMFTDQSDDQKGEEDKFYYRYYPYSDENIIRFNLAEYKTKVDEFTYIYINMLKKYVTPVSGEKNILYECYIENIYLKLIKGYIDVALTTDPTSKNQVQSIDSGEVAHEFGPKEGEGFGLGEGFGPGEGFSLEKGFGPGEGFSHGFDTSGLESKEQIGGDLSRHIYNVVNSSAELNFLHNCEENKQIIHTEKTKTTIKQHAFFALFMFNTMKAYSNQFDMNKCYITYKECKWLKTNHFRFKYGHSYIMQAMGMFIDTLIHEFMVEEEEMVTIMQKQLKDIREGNDNSNIIINKCADLLNKLGPNKEKNIYINEMIQLLEKDIQNAHNINVDDLFIGVCVGDILVGSERFVHKRGKSFKTDIIYVLKVIYKSLQN